MVSGARETSLPPYRKSKGGVMGDYSYQNLLETLSNSPSEFMRLLETGYSEERGEVSLPALCRSLVDWIRSLSGAELPPVFSDIIALVKEKSGIQFAYNLMLRMEAALGYRKPSLGIYDNAFHFIGGAQKYGCTIAHALQEQFDITLIANTDISVQKLQEWYDLDLQRCRIKVVRIPFYAAKEAHSGVFDAGEVDLKGDNPFHIVSKESGNYDFFINNCMLEMVFPLANVSELVCHFPEREISRFFHVDKYDHIIYNSEYTAEWIKKRWNLTPHKHIYPPVDMESEYSPELKKNIILSASRFELSGNKQQMEMIKAFMRLRRNHPQTLKGWKLVLAGGSTELNPYLEKIKNLTSLLPAENCELKINISAEELKRTYAQAKLFWHFSGLGQRDPARVEHFGMTTVEAMQNGCVPVVFKGGGLKEIVKEGISGALFSNLEEQQKKSLDLITDSSFMSRLARGAVERGKQFTKKIFMSKVREHFSRLLSIYLFKKEA